MISDYSKYKVSKAFIFGLSIVVILWLFGPYEYKIYDYGGIVYFAFCCFLLLLGMRCRNLVFRRKSINDESNDSRIIHFYLSDKAVLFMCVIDIISIIEGHSERL